MASQVNYAKEIENKLDPILGEKSKIQLPDNWKKVIVEYVPVVSMILGVLSAITVISNVMYFHFNVSFIFTIIQIALSIGFTVMFFKAYAGLKARQKSGWDFFYYAELLFFAYYVVSALSNALSSGIFGILNIIGPLISIAFSALISMYFLFQIKNYYTNSIH